MKIILIYTVLMLLNMPIYAKEQTITLELPTMNCAMCPYTVKKALNQVDGVVQAKVTYETKSAVVVFDNEKTNAEKLVEATSNAGYPSTLRP